MKTFQTIDELEAFLLKHGESSVDLMGGEIDRIEMKLRVSSMLTRFSNKKNGNFHFFFFNRKNSSKFGIVIF